MSFKVFQKANAPALRRQTQNSLPPQNSLPQPRPFATPQAARLIGAQTAEEGAEQAARHGHDFGLVGVGGGDAAPAARGRHRGAALPARLRAGIERLSGQPMGDVRVHYDSAEPARVGAHAHTAGSEIHLAPGQERHLPHEAWHAAQQKQGRVRATGLIAGRALNEDHALESEADRMGAAALRPGARAAAVASPARAGVSRHAATGGPPAIQRAKRKNQPKRAPRKRAKLTQDFKKKRTPPKKATQRRAKYLIGQHGAKGREQKRLSSAYGIKVTGDTHESEHTIGFEPLNQTSGIKRGTAGRARTLENKAPAYQEYKPLHRDHIGTGTTNTVDQSGFNSYTYRQYQRSLVESGDISSAVQLNQLGYAFDPRFKKLSSTPEGKSANDSFNTMVENMEGVTYAQDTSDVSKTVDAKQRAEMHLSRMSAQLGRFPTEQEENEVRKKFGLPSIEEQKKQKEDEERKKSNVN